MLHKTRIVIICGGSFQGKSLISLHLASLFKFSGVITTDMVRNILKAVSPENDYLSTSTYLLPDSLLQKQMALVSDVTKDMITIYQERGEHIIIEGMHFSEDFLAWASPRNFCKICVNNVAPLTDRIIHKGITRSRLGIYDPISNERTNTVINKSNVDNSTYVKHQERIQEIHYRILNNSMKYGFTKVEFNDIERGIEVATTKVEQWMESL